MIDREEFEKACPVPEGVYWESWGNGDGQYEAVSPEHEEFADVQQARLQGWQAARAQSGQGAEPVAITRGVLDKYHRFGRIEYLGDASVPPDGSELYLCMISMYHDERGMYERPVHYMTKMETES